MDLQVYGKWQLLFCTFLKHKDIVDCTSQFITDFCFLRMDGSKYITESMEGHFNLEVFMLIWCWQYLSSMFCKVSWIFLWCWKPVLTVLSIHVLICIHIRWMNLRTHLYIIYFCGLVCQNTHYLFIMNSWKHGFTCCYPMKWGRCDMHWRSILKKKTPRFCEKKIGFLY